MQASIACTRANPGAGTSGNLSHHSERFAAWSIRFQRGLQHLRYHVLEIHNQNSIDLTEFRTRLQLPEAVGRRPYSIKADPTGPKVSFEPDNTPARVAMSNGSYEVKNNTIALQAGQGANGPVMIAGSSRVCGPKLYRADVFAPGCTGAWLLSIDRVPARGNIEIEFYTEDDALAPDYSDVWRVCSANQERDPFSGPPLFYVMGTFQYVVTDVSKPQRSIFVALKFDKGTRITSSEIAVAKPAMDPVTIQLSSPESFGLDGKCFDPGESKPNSVTGMSISGNGQRAAAVDISNSGGSGSVGLDINATGKPGQNVTGLRVDQRGSGTGLRVIQTGPGVGVRVTVGSGSH